MVRRGSSEEEWCEERGEGVVTWSGEEGRGGVV